MDDPGATSVEAVVRRIDEHSFCPVDNGFTVDSDTGYDGVSDHGSTDWRVRTLAIRDLLRLGADAEGRLVAALQHENSHVRQITAMVLGLRRAEDTTESLEELLRTDDDPVVRSQAAIALGQIGQPSEVLERQAEREEHTDVRHQCTIARDRIRKKEPVEPEVADAFRSLEPSTFGRLEKGDAAPDFELEDTGGRPWRLSNVLGEKTVVLLWVFADWCPVCHKEFHELIERADAFQAQDIAVATLECHDRYRCRVMRGEEVRPSYWFADHFPENGPMGPYPDEIWWPHLVDRAATVGLRYGIDPWQFAVHSEWVNRPTTVIIDPEGVVQLAYAGDYWGDRPTIGQILKMIETEDYRFEAPPPREGPH